MEPPTTPTQPTQLAQPIPVYFLLRRDIIALDLIGPAEVLRYANRTAEKEGQPAAKVRRVSIQTHGRYVPKRRVGQAYKQGGPALVENAQV